MKNIIYTLLTVFMYSCTSAQNVVDMANSHNINWERKNGQYYLKDVNDYMLPYLGTWSYIDGNKEFRITLTKVTMFHNTQFGDNYYEDGLRIQYQKFENGQLIFNSPTETYPTGIIKEFGKLKMTFRDYQRDRVGFQLSLTLIPNENNQYNLNFHIYNGLEARNTYYQQHPTEPYYSVPNNIIMTKL